MSWADLRDSNRRTESSAKQGPIGPKVWMHFWNLAFTRATTSKTWQLSHSLQTRRATLWCAMVLLGPYLFGEMFQSLWVVPAFWTVATMFSSPAPCTSFSARARLNHAFTHSQGNAERVERWMGRTNAVNDNRHVRKRPKAAKVRHCARSRTIPVYVDPHWFKDDSRIEGQWSLRAPFATGRPVAQASHAPCQLRGLKL